MDNTKILQDDLLRYKKNSLPANLALLGLVFDMLYFCILYAFTQPNLTEGSQPTWFVSILIGFSVILTLVTMLVMFLASEGIKGYKKGYIIVLFVLAAIQFARIFVYPIYVLQHPEFTRTYFWIRTDTSTFLGIMMIVWLCLSIACLIAAGIIGYKNCLRLEKHMSDIESGKIDIDLVFKSDKEAIIAKESPEVADVTLEEVK